MATKIKTVRGIDVYKKKHKTIQAMLADQDYPSIHGDKIWPASYFIMDYLDVNPLPPKTRVMEIGCGWGLLSIYCAKTYNARVTAIDADAKVFPFLDLHAERNSVDIRKKALRYEKITPKMLQGVDIVAGGDICFWEELVNPLFRFIKRAVAQEVGTIVIADPGRPPFLKLAKRCRKMFGGQLLDYTIVDPSVQEGYLLLIYN